MQQRRRNETLQYVEEEEGDPVAEEEEGDSIAEEEKDENPVAEEKEVDPAAKFTLQVVFCVVAVQCAV